MRRYSLLRSRFARYFFILLLALSIGLDAAPLLAASSKHSAASSFAKSNSTAPDFTPDFPTPDIIAPDTSVPGAPKPGAPKPGLPGESVPMSLGKFGSILQHFDAMNSQLRNNSMNSLDFFRTMGRENLSMLDLNTFKGEYIKRQTAILERDLGGGSNTLAAARQKWIDTYGGIEQRLLYDRAKAVDRIAHREIGNYLKQNPGEAVLYMPVGSASLSNLYFGGDIDITLVAMYMDSTGAVAQRVINALQSELGLSMQALDAIFTPHRQASADVYVGDINADIVDGAVNDRSIGNYLVFELDANGNVISRRPNMTDVVLRLERIRRGSLMSKGLGAYLDSLPGPDQSVPRAGGEPMASLELLRHLHADVVEQSLSPTEQLTKLAKYLRRSMERQRDLHQQAGESNMLMWADRMETIRRNQTLPDCTRVRQIMEASYRLLGINPDNASMAQLQRSIKDFGRLVEGTVRRNVDLGVQIRRTELAELRKHSESAADADVDVTVRDLLDIQRAYLEKNIPFPESAARLLSDLQSSRGQTVLRVPAAELDQIRRALKRGAEKPDGLGDIIAGVVWQRVCKYYSNANEAVSALNNILDTLDNNTIAYLRTWDRTFNFGVSTPDGRFSFKIPINIAKINQKLNASVLGKVGGSLPFQAFNLYSQADALWQALNSSDDPREVTSNVAAELFRNWPPGRVIEALVMESYLRAGISVIYAFFPTLAVPEAVYGMCVAAADWGYQRSLRANYQTMVDLLFTSSTFEQNADGSFTLTGVNFPLPGGKAVQVDRDNLPLLPQKAAQIANALLHEVREHPEIAMYHELLGHQSVSGGQINDMSWPRRYKDLSAPGSKMWVAYAKAIERVTAEFFMKVIEELEKRKLFESGEDARMLVGICLDLGLTVRAGEGEKLRKVAGGSRESIQKFMDLYEEYKKTSAELEAFKKRWDTGFILAPAVRCMPASVASALETLKKDLQTCKKSHGLASTDVANIIGEEAVTEAILKPAVTFRTGYEYSPDGSQSQFEMRDKYKAYLDSLRGKGQAPQLTIIGPEKIVTGQKTDFAMQLDRKPRLVRYEWTATPGADFAGLKNRSVTVTARKTGSLTLKARAQLGSDDGILGDVDGPWVEAQHKVTVIAPEDAPEAAIKLTCPLSFISAGELAVITAETLELGLNADDFEEYWWKVNGELVTVSNDNTFIFNGVGFEGKKVRIECGAKRKAGFVKADLHLDVLAPGPISSVLRVDISPALTELDVRRPASFDALVVVKQGGGRLFYQWTLDGKIVGNEEGYTFDPAPYEGRSVTLGLYAAQMPDPATIACEGKSELTFKVVRNLPLSVALAPHPGRITDAREVKICVKEPRQNLNYEWREVNLGDQFAGSGPCMTHSGRGLAGQSLRFKVTATDAKKNTASALSSLIDVLDDQPIEVAPVAPAPDWEDEALAAPPLDLEVLDEQSTSLTDGLPDDAAATDDAAAGTQPDDAAANGKDAPGKDAIKPATADSQADPAQGNTIYFVDPPTEMREDEAVTFKVRIPESLLKNKDGLYVYWGWKNMPAAYVILKQSDSLEAPEITVRPFSAVAGNDSIVSRDQQGNIRQQGQLSMRVVLGRKKGGKESIVSSAQHKVVIHKNGVSATVPKGWTGSNENAQYIYSYGGEIEGMKCSVSSGLTWNKTPRILGGTSLNCMTTPGGGGKTPISLGEYKGSYTLDKDPKLQVKPYVMKHSAGPEVLAVLPYAGIEAALCRDQVMLNVVGSCSADWESIPANDTTGATVARAQAMSEAAGKQLEAILKSMAVEPGASTSYGLQEADAAPEGAPFTIKRVSPASGKVPAGSTVTFAVTPPKDIKEKITYRFEPHPEVAFTPHETTKTSTSAVFSEPGTIKVWASALVDGKTVGESNQLDLEVVGPDLTLAVKPQKPKIGQETFVTMTAKPEAPKGYNVIWDVSGAKYSRGGGKAAKPVVYSFVPDEAGSYLLKAELVSPNGASLGKKELSVTVGGYTVEVKNLGPVKSRPKEWAEGKGLQAVPKNSFVVDEQTRVAASFKEKDAPKDVVWKWTLGPGTSSPALKSSPEATLYGKAPGTASATVEARDKEGRLLGKGSISFPVVAAPKEAVKEPTASDFTLKLQKSAFTGKHFSAEVTVAKPFALRDYVFAWESSHQDPKQMLGSGPKVSIGPAAGKAPADVKVRVKNKKGKILAKLTGEVPILPPNFSISLGKYAEYPPYLSHTGQEITLNRGEYVRDTIIIISAFPEYRNLPGLKYQWTVSGPIRVEAGNDFNFSRILRLEGLGKAKAVCTLFINGKECASAELELAIPVSQDHFTALREYKSAMVSFQNKKYEQAVSSLERAIKLDPDNPFLKEKLKEVREAMAEQARLDKAKKDAEALWAEAARLEGKKEYPQAIGKYEEGLVLYDSEVIRKKVAYLKHLLAQLEEKRKKDCAQAGQLTAAAAQKQAAGKLADALSDLKAAQKLCPSPELEENIKLASAEIARQKEACQKAGELWQQGAALYQRKDYDAALGKYRQGLDLCPDAEAQKNMNIIEAAKKTAEEKARKAAEAAEAAAQKAAEAAAAKKAAEEAAAKKKAEAEAEAAKKAAEAAAKKKAEEEAAKIKAEAEAAAAKEKAAKDKASAPPAAPLDVSGIPGIEDVPPQAKSGATAPIGSIPKDISGRYLNFWDGDFEEKDTGDLMDIKQSGSSIRWSAPDGSETGVGTYNAATGRLIIKEEDGADTELECRVTAKGIRCVGPVWTTNSQGKRIDLGVMRMEPTQSRSGAKKESARPAQGNASSGGAGASGKYPAQVAGTYALAATSDKGKPVNQTIVIEQDGSKVRLVEPRSKDTLTGTYDQNTGRINATYRPNKNAVIILESTCLMNSGAIVCQGSMRLEEKGKVQYTSPVRFTKGAAAPAPGKADLSDISGRYRMTGTVYGQTMTQHYRATQTGNKVVMHCEEYPDLPPYQGTYANGVLAGDFDVVDVGDVRAKGRVRLEFSLKNGKVTCKGYSSVTSSIMEPFETTLSCEKIQ